jgi:hypothetical protein
MSQIIDVKHCPHCNKVIGVIVKKVADEYALSNENFIMLFEKMGEFESLDHGLILQCLSYYKARIRNYPEHIYSYEKKQERLDYIEKQQKVIKTMRCLDAFKNRKRI